MRKAITELMLRGPLAPQPRNAQRTRFAVHQHVLVQAVYSFVFPVEVPTAMSPEFEISTRSGFAAALPSAPICSCFTSSPESMNQNGSPSPIPSLSTKPDTASAPALVPAPASVPAPATALILSRGLIHCNSRTSMSPHK